MKDSELHDTACLLISAIAAEFPNSKWPMDVRSFAVAAKELATKGNSVAAKFWITQNAAGYTCPDFNEAIRTAFFAGLVEYLSPEYTHMMLPGIRVADVLIRRHSFSQSDLEETVALMKAQHLEATGRESP